MLSPIFFRPRALGVVRQFTGAGTTAFTPDYVGIWRVQQVGGGGGGSGSDTFYDRYGIAGFAGQFSVSSMTLKSTVNVVVGAPGVGGAGSQNGSLPGSAGSGSSVSGFGVAGGSAGTGWSSSFSGQRPSSWPGNSSVGAGGAGGGIAGSRNGQAGGSGRVQLTLIG